MVEIKTIVETTEVKMSQAALDRKIHETKQSAKAELIREIEEQYRRSVICKQCQHRKDELTCIEFAFTDLCPWWRDFKKQHGVS